MSTVVENQTQDEACSLDDLAREGARRMLVAALEEEVTAYVERHRVERDERGHAQVLRNGRARRRKVTLGSGTVEVSAPRVNDRRTDESGRRQRFTSSILPPYMRRSPKVAEVLLGARQDGTKELLTVVDGYRARARRAGSRCCGT